MIPEEKQCEARKILKTLISSSATVFELLQMIELLDKYKEDHKE